VIATSTHGKVQYNIFTYEHVITSSNMLLKVFTVLVYIVGALLTFGWIIVHCFQNRSIFKPNLIMKTYFPPTFALPVDLKTSRIVFKMACIAHLVVVFLYVGFRWKLLLFLISPLFGIAASQLFNPFLVCCYIFSSAFSVVYSSNYLLSNELSSCSYSKSQEATYCDSLPVISSTMFIFFVSLLLLFQFLAYSFLYKILRYKIWLTQQSSFQSTESGFDYQLPTEDISKPDLD